MDLSAFTIRLRYKSAYMPPATIMYCCTWRLRDLRALVRENADVENLTEAFVACKYYCRPTMIIIENRTGAKKKTDNIYFNEFNPPRRRLKCTFDYYYYYYIRCVFYE